MASEKCTKCEKVFAFGDCHPVCNECYTGGRGTMALKKKDVIEELTQIPGSSYFLHTGVSDGVAFIDSTDGIVYLVLPEIAQVLQLERIANALERLAPTVVQEDEGEEK